MLSLEKLKISKLYIRGRIFFNVRDLLYTNIGPIFNSLREDPKLNTLTCFFILFSYQTTLKKIEHNLLVVFFVKISFFSFRNRFYEYFKAV